MHGVYVYAHDCEDFTTTGLAGDLRPIECHFEEEKNGLSQITMTLAYDEYGKWAHVLPGRYIKCKVPVRVPPVIADDAYATMVQSYRVVQQQQSTFSLRAVQVPAPPKLPKVPLFFNKNGLDYGKPHYLLEDGDIVYAKSPEDPVYSPGGGSGYVNAANLEYLEDVTIPACLEGLETATGTVRLQYQYFIVTHVTQNLDGVSVTAMHVFYELLTNMTTYKTENTVSGAAACVQVMQNLASPDDRFTILSDCKDTVKGLDLERYNVAQALLDPDNGICARYGLSLLRDNYNLYALQKVGTDRGFVVEYSKNLLDIERTENIENTVTRIIPFGKDKKGEMVFMDGTQYVDSPRIGDYPMPRVQYLDCSDTATESKDMTLAQVKAELKKRAEAEYEAGCDLPEVSMRVEFLSLGDTEEYRQYRDLDKVYLFDIVTVKDKMRGYDYSAQVVAVTHDVLTGQLLSVTLGSVQKSTGVRKIATWQVPEVDGTNIRLKSIAPGALGDGSVTENTLQENIVGKVHIKDATIDEAKIEDASITNAKIALLAVGEANIQDLAVTTAKIAEAAITAAKIAEAAIGNAHIQNASIDTAKIAVGAITQALIAQGAIGSAQIADASITDAHIVELTANKITTGTLSVERLIIRGSEQSIIYEINNMGELVSQQVDTIDAYVLTERTITADKIVAGAITSNEIAAHTITANNILANTITAEELAALCITADKIAAQAIEVNHLASSVGSDLDLSSNESLKMAVVAGVQNSAMTLTADEMSVAFNGKNVLVINAESADFDLDTVSVSGQIIGNVVNTQETATITVPTGASIQAVIDDLGKYLNGWVTINIQGAHAENLLIEGFKGKYPLTLNVESGAYLQGTIAVRQCDYVRIWCADGMQKTAFIIPPVGSPGVSAINVGCFECNNLYVAGQNSASDSGFYLADGTHAKLYQCNASQVQNGYLGSGNAMVAMYACIGGGTDDLAFGANAVLAQWGTMMSLYGNGPYGTQNDQGGFGMIRDNSSAKVASGGTVPVVAQTITMTPSESKGAVYGTQDGSDSYVHPWGYYLNPFQGYNKGAGGYMFGLWLYTDDYTAFHNTISGKTIQSATLTLKRANAYGVDGSTVHLFYHGLTSVQSNQRPSEILTDTGLSAQVDRGKSVTFTLNSDLIAKLQDGTIKGFGLSSAGSTELMQFEGEICDLTVVYEA